MTVQEASERYNIPIKILNEYESWGLCDAVRKVMGVWQYDEEDIQRLSMIMTLHDIGFEKEEVETYMKLLLVGESTQQERMRMLNEKKEWYLWTKSISKKSSWTGWIIFALKSKKGI